MHFILLCTRLYKLFLVSSIPMPCALARHKSNHDSQHNNLVPKFLFHLHSLTNFEKSQFSTLYDLWNFFRKQQSGSNRRKEIRNTLWKTFSSKVSLMKTKCNLSRKFGDLRIFCTRPKKRHQINFFLRFETELRTKKFET